ncbi:MAG TPA: hypothetical protein VED63_11245 [Acidimicrobiales bacterium]|nr:hypothetical protein [Acidimicrobiales bacterium]
MVRTRLIMATVMVGALLALGGAAGATPTTTGIGPNQHFTGLVNKKSTKAIITMACALPLSTVSMGHPLGGQTVAVEPPTTVAGRSGDTGSRGRSIVASFVAVTPVNSATSSVTFTRYGSLPIPTTLVLPCSGSGTVVFAPEPTSKTAENATVSVTYGNVTVDPPPTTEATASRTILVTQADNGYNYRLHTGDVLDVQLTGPSGVTWTEPSSSNQVVLRRTGGSPGTAATGTLVARSPGKAQVTALGTPNCSAPCPDFIVAFQVGVTVVG